MNTYLGVSSLLSADDLDEAAIADGAVLYMEGYLFDRDDAKKAFGGPPPSPTSPAARCR